MPKKSSKSFWGGRGRLNNSEDKHYFGHDDRTNRLNDGSKFGNKPRVSFKNTNFKPDRTRRNFLMKQHLDDDVLMSASSNNNTRQVIQRGRGKGFLRGRNSPLPHGVMRDNTRQIPISDTNWYRILIPQGQKYTKDFIISHLRDQMAPFSFCPFMYKVIGTDAVFYVEDHRAALKLADCDKRIILRDGFKMQVRVRPGMPPLDISDALKERLKQTMSKRYFQEKNALDLSNLYRDPDLADDYWCPLARPNLLLAVLDIIQEHIPNIEALNLDSNKLQNIDKLNLLASKFKKLKILHIGDNKIKDMSYLSALKDLQLEELRVEGNPMCIKYKSRQDDYVSDIRKMFPKLLKLDGKDLPPPIVFDVDDQKDKLPSTQRMFIAQSNKKAQDVASQFLQQYFIIFDSENRQPLLEAYHEHACFSLTATISQGSNKFSQYMLESRNLCKIPDTNRRRRLLKQGRLPVVSFISEMPRTKHDLNSFTMDLSLVTEGMILVTVTGLYKELCSKDKEFLRYFNRTFVIVPEGTGFCISNEQLHVSNPTVNQEKQFDCSGPVIEPTPGPSTTSVAITNTAPLTEEVKQQMIMTLSQQTNMNMELCLNCLEAVHWNFEDARAAFQEAFSSGKIPPNAFTQ